MNRKYTKLLDAKKLRNTHPSHDEIHKIQRNPIYIIIDNVLDTYNIGAIFRLADAIAAEKVYLVGESAEPTDKKVGHKIHKASVGVWQWVPWKKVKTVQDAVDDIKKKEKTIHIVAVEQHKRSIDYKKAKYHFPIAFIVGHETSGVSKEALLLSDNIVEIPMWGINKSLNVMVSLAIVLWEAMGKKSRL